MNFQAPGALFWFIPLGAFILALYLLRMRRQDFVFPASFLWPERQDEIRANSLFQKLRFNWLWVLQLLALLLLTLGLARWQVRQSNLLGKSTVLVIDASASMRSADVAPSRFAEAVSRASRIANAMRPGDAVAVIEAGPTPRVLTGLEGESAKVANAIRGLRPTDAPSDIGEALRLATALVGRNEEAEIILLSDGCFDPVESISPGKAEIRYEPIGESGENVGVSALGTAQTPTGLQAYVGVKNYGANPARTALSVYADDRVVWSQQLTVAPNSTVGRNIDISGKAEIVSAQISEGGFLKADDRRSTPGNPSGSIRVLLVSKGNVFLETGLTLDPRVVLDKAATVPDSELASASGRSNYDLVIFDSEPEVAVKSPYVVTFGAPGVASPVRGSGTRKKPPLITSTGEGVLDDVSFENVYFDRLHTVEPVAGARVLARADSLPMVVERRSGRSQLYFAFDLLDGDFPLSISFPILLGNLLDSAAGSEIQGITALQAGQSIALPAPGDVPLTVRRPNGDVESVPAVYGRYSLRNLDEVGRFVVGEGENQKQFLVNLVSERESTIAPVEEVRLGTGGPVATRSLERFADLWKPLVLVMLGVLTLEWLLFMKRS